MEEKIKFPLIPDNALINIEVSGHFLKKFQKLLLKTCEDLDDEDLLATLEKMKTDDGLPEGLSEEVIFLLLPLVDAVEKAAETQKKIEYVDLNNEEATEVLNKMFN